MPWFAYQLDPIDYWEGWVPYDPPQGELPTVEELRRRPVAADDDEYLQSKLFESYQVAVDQFRDLDWEGDGHWQYAGIPPAGGGPGPEFILSVKQQNNGTVYVLSPVPLQYLED